MNTITIHFVPCDPAPASGYNVQWRVFGSADPYTDAGNFFTSPAIFTDGLNPNGTSYEGVLRSDCTESGESGQNLGNDIPWNAIAEESGGGDSSSCGTTISIETESALYTDLGYFILNVAGSSLVELTWTTFDRPNRFALYDNDTMVESTGWRGEAPYPGPWGATLSTTQTGVISFTPVPGHEYKVRVEVGPADPDNVETDGFSINIACS